MGGNIEAPFYRIMSLNLTSAGSYDLNGELGLIHMVRAENSSGGLALDTKVDIRLGDVENDNIPLSVNGQINASGFSRARFTWAAQSGVTAYFALSRSDQRFRVEAPPAKQIVTSALADQAPYSRETVGTSAGGILAANGSRHSVGLKADPANTGIIYVASDAGVTTSTGWPLAAGESVIFHHLARIDAIASAAGQTLHVCEETN